MAELLVLRQKVVAIASVVRPRRQAQRGRDDGVVELGDGRLIPALLLVEGAQAEQALQLSAAVAGLPKRRQALVQAMAALYR